jgi:hypothetical protein
MVILPGDESLEAALQKMLEAEERPAGSGDGSHYTWTSSKEAEKNKTKSGGDAPSSPEMDPEE